MGATDKRATEDEAMMQMHFLNGDDDHPPTLFDF